MKVIGVIPARLESTRLPRKMLLADTGQPLVKHTWDAVQGCRLVDEWWVATDSDEIASIDGIRAVMTTSECRTGMDRVAEAVANIEEPCIVVNVQGDEPLINPEYVDQLVWAMKRDAWKYGTLAAIEGEYPCTLVFCDENYKATMFYRSDEPRANGLHHIGVYAYEINTLKQLAAKPSSASELFTKLEQGRALSYSIPIHVEVVQRKAFEVNTQEDYNRFVTQQWCNERKGLFWKSRVSSKRGGQ